MKIGVVAFPGSNCDHDAWYAAGHELGAESVMLFHKDHDLQGVDAIILPGGFSFGDYLRCGAIARFSPIMQEVIRFANDGNPVLGICNGFQILCESGLLPGSLLRNRDLKFVSRHVLLKVENNHTIYTSEYRAGQILSIPIAHGDGNYFADEATLDALEAENRVVLRYCDKNGVATDESNPNGAARNIAGIINAEGNVMGLMPHPERACSAQLGSTDGRGVFASLIASANLVVA